MADLHGVEQRALQADFDTVRLADRLNELIVLTEIPDEHRAFIESRDMVFLSTVDHRGYPTCSYKGGAPGFIKVLDPRTLALPSYDGNGMFLSMGNLAGNAKLGMLFIDFETPHRLRLHGTASISQDDPLLPSCPGAQLIARISVTELFVNCPRYVHRYQRLQTSRYAPQADGSKPPGPKWKRIDLLQDALLRREQGLASALGGVISQEDYVAMLRQGDG